MFNPYLKSARRLYATPLAFLAAALFLSTALLAPAPQGYLSDSLAVVYGASCVLMSWAGWKRLSDRSMTPLAIPYAEGK